MPMEDDLKNFKMEDDLKNFKTKKIINRTIISFVQPQPNSIQNKNNPIGCGTVPGNLVCRFSAFYGQRSVTAAWATRSPWSIK